MKPSRLSEMHVETRLEAGQVRVVATHLPTGTVVEEIEPLASPFSVIQEKRKAKERAYRKLAKLLTEQGL